MNLPVNSANLCFLAAVTLISIYMQWFMFWSMAITALRNSGPFVDSFLYFFKFIAFTSLIPPTTFLISNEKFGHFVSDYPILSAFGLPSIICRRHHADDILAKKMKKNPPSPSPHQIPLYPLLYCSEVWWRNYLRLNPLNLGPSNFWFLCVPLLQLPAFHPNNCLQQTPRTIYYDTFLEWSVLCFFSLLCIEAKW